MSFLRRLSTRRLLAVIGGALAVVAGGTAIAIAATSSSPVPPKESLPVAVRQALAAPAVKGVTARIAFTNELIDSSSVPGSTPLLTGATGRLWATADGYVRLELQSAQGGGDVQILVKGNDVSLYEAGSKTLYKATLPEEKAGKKAEKEHGIPTLSALQKALRHLRSDANVSGATPTSVAGRGAYSVEISPKRDGGLVGAAKIAWDAVTGTPLRVGVYAAGRQDPVLELTATDISYGDVDAGVFDVAAPADAKVVDLTPQLQELADKKGDHGQKAGNHKAKGVSGAAAVRKAAGFDVSAPAALAGLPRKAVRLVTVDGHQAALAIYGKGLGAIAVLQSPAEKPAAGDDTGKGDDVSKALPEVSIDGATGHELATALGTVITFERDGVSYTVLGSVPPAAAEAAARGL